MIQNYRKINLKASIKYLKSKENSRYKSVKSASKFPIWTIVILVLVNIKSKTSLLWLRALLTCLKNLNTNLQ